MQLQHLTVRRMQPGSYSFGLALCSPEDAIWGTKFDDKEMIHNVSASWNRKGKTQTGHSVFYVHGTVHLSNTSF
jgi:hypothetical protein